MKKNNNSSTRHSLPAKAAYHKIRSNYKVVVTVVMESMRTMFAPMTPYMVINKSLLVVGQKWRRATRRVFYSATNGVKFLAHRF